ncbi:hypothetical protein SUGI_0436090 [Cryptomeria japonica]|uniref:ATG8-interacting protein 1 n=1 Tax=Cryptomeria japonica TaxID=3369 RepID=UPI002408D94F|nr:ATG8-interacting protein 1 [Cryptomeria japonica]GLJ23099.1 hypothetical protein SUGI_0436090 [Cryptomeria japonica]
MAEGGGSDSDDNSMANAKDWEMISIAASCTSEVCTEPSDYPDDFIFPPKLHEGLPIETSQGSGIVNSRLGFNDYADGFEENDKNESPRGRGVESLKFEAPEFFSEVQDLGVCQNEGVCDSEVGENFVLENEEEVLVNSKNMGEYLEPYDIWGWGFRSGVKGFVDCEDWWKRQVDRLGQPNTLWSIAMAAALVGVVVLGQRWRSEKWKNVQIRQQLCANDEKISELLCQVAQLKDAISGRQKVTVVKSGFS